MPQPRLLAVITSEFCSLNDAIPRKTRAWQQLGTAQPPRLAVLDIATPHTCAEVHPRIMDSWCSSQIRLIDNMAERFLQ